MQNLPPPLDHPPFARLLFEHGLTYLQAAAVLQSSRETIRLICLPFDDPRRRVPGRRLMAAIVQWSGGRIVPADFYVPMTRQVAA